MTPTTIANARAAWEHVSDLTRFDIARHRPSFVAGDGRFAEPLHCPPGELLQQHKNRHVVAQELPLDPALVATQSSGALIFHYPHEGIYPNSPENPENGPALPIELRMKELMEQLECRSDRLGLKTNTMAWTFRELVLNATQYTCYQNKEGPFARKSFFVEIGWQFIEEHPGSTIELWAANPGSRMFNPAEFLNMSDQTYLDRLMTDLESGLSNSHNGTIVLMQYSAVIRYAWQLHDGSQVGVLMQKMTPAEKATLEGQDPNDPWRLPVHLRAIKIDADGEYDPDYNSNVFLEDVARQTPAKTVTICPRFEISRIPEVA